MLWSGTVVRRWNGVVIQRRISWKTTDTGGILGLLLEPWRKKCCAMAPCPGNGRREPANHHGDVSLEKNWLDSGSWVPWVGKSGIAKHVFFVNYSLFVPTNPLNRFRKEGMYALDLL